MTSEKWILVLSSNFKKQYKKVSKQGKDLNKIDYVIDKLAKRGEKLEQKYKDHILINNKHYMNCRECHIEPDWPLVYQYEDNILNLLLVATDSHIKIFK